MKRLFLTVLLVTSMVFFIHPSFASGTSNETEVTNDLYQGQGQQLFGGTHTQFMIFDSEPSEIPRQFIPSYSDPQFLNAPPPLYQGWKVWQGPRAIPYCMLYPLDTAERLVDNKFQWSGWANYPSNQDPIMRLNQRPIDPDIFIVELPGPDRGILEETVKRALSLAKGYSGTRRVYIEYQSRLEPKASGLSIGGNATNSNILSLNHALAFSASPMIGWSQTEVQEPHIVKVYCYKDGPMDGSVITKKPSGTVKEKLPLILFDFDQFNIRSSEKDKIKRHYLYTKRIWPDVVKNDHMILFIGGCDVRGAEGYNDTLGMERAKEVMLEIGAMLVEDGLPEAEVEKILRYVSAGKRQPVFSDHQNNRHVAMVRAKKISKH